MQKEFCNKCSNQDTAWCKGCEHNFPGVDQFDFFREIKLTEAAQQMEENL